MQSPEAVAALSTLANSHRLALFRRLVQVGPEGLSAGSIATELGTPASSLSFHLAHLHQAGLVKQDRRGRSIIYSADYDVMNALISYLLENCCAGPGVCAPGADCDAAQPEREKERA